MIASLGGQGLRGAVDGAADTTIYDRFIGCQMRTVLCFKKDDVALSVLTSAIIAPDLDGLC